MWQMAMILLHCTMEAFCLIFLGDTALKVYFSKPNNIHALIHHKLAKPAKPSKPESNIEQKVYHFMFGVYDFVHEEPALQLTFWEDNYVYFYSCAILTSIILAIYLAIRIYMFVRSTTIRPKMVEDDKPKTFTKRTSVKHWLKAFDVYLETSGVVYDPNKCQAILNKLDYECLKLVTNYKGYKKNNYASLITTMNELFKQDTKDIRQCVKDFEERDQLPDENINQYYAVLEHLSSKSLLDASTHQRDQHVVERFIDGVRSDALRADLAKYIHSSKNYANLFDYAKQVAGAYSRRTITFNKLSLHDTLCVCLKSTKLKMQPSSNIKVRCAKCNPTNKTNVTRSVCNKVCFRCNEHGHIRKQCMCTMIPLKLTFLQ